jgi:CubicO group peptidase (beta-lactamase class C family)
MEEVMVIGRDHVVSMLRSVLALVAGFTLVCAPAAPAQRVMPGTYRDVGVMPGGIVGERVQATLDAVNSGDADQINAYLDAHLSESFLGMLPEGELSNLMLNVNRVTGGLDFHGVRVYDPPVEDELVVIAEGRELGIWRGLVFHFTDTPDSLISALMFAPARPPTDIEEPALTDETLVAELDRMVTSLCANDRFSGTVLVARGRDVLYERACGEASKTFHVPNRIDTKFNIGSMNKMFTSVAVARLVEQGLLSYDDPVSDHLDETWLPRDISERVTVHHLLTHTSGLGSFFNDEFMRSSRLLFRELEDYKPLLRSDTLAFEPGTDYQYSNSGMFLLGAVIESVTGEDYYRHIRENIYAPAGMTDSDCFDVDCPTENLAVAYYPSEHCPGGWATGTFQHTVRGGPAGGGYSTAPDLHRFALALLDGTLLSDEAVRRMWTDHSGNGYGYGFGLSSAEGELVAGHGGGFIGINANLDIFIESGIVVAVLANYDSAASPLATAIRSLVARLND